MATPRKPAEKPDVIDAEFTDSDGMSLAELQSHETAEDSYIPDDVAITQLLADLGDDPNAGKVNVYKLRDGNFRDQVFLFDCLPSEFGMHMLQDPEYHQDKDEKHKFRVILRNSTGIGTARTVTVMPKKVHDVATPVFNPADIVTPITQVITAMQENTNRLLAQIASANAQQPKTTLEFLQEMQMMRELFGTNQPAQNSQSPLEVLQLAKELASAMNPEATNSGFGVMEKLIDMFGKPIAEAVMKMPATPPMPRRNPMPSVVPLPPTTAPISPANTLTDNPAQPVNESDNDMGMVQDAQFKMAIGYLVQQAKRNGDVFTYANMVLDQGGEQVIPLLQNDSYIDILAKYDADVLQYRPWFEQLRDEIFALLAEDDLTGEETSDINEVITETGSGNGNTIEQETDITNPNDNATNGDTQRGAGGETNP